MTATVSQSPASHGSKSTYTHTINISSEDSTDPEERDSKFETVAELQCAFSERFKSKIDLGNCLEVLYLAK